MNADTVNQLLDALAARFGTTAAHLWGVLVREAYLTWVDVGMGLLVMLSAGGVWLLCYRRMQQADSHTFKWERWFAGTILFGGIALCGLAVAAIVLPAAIRATLNPEFYALKYVLTMLAGA